jgi:hypothetical protein
LHVLAGDYVQNAAMGMQHRGELAELVDYRRGMSVTMVGSGLRLCLPDGGEGA